MRCPKCHSLTRVDLQSLLDHEGVRYRRACVACSWDAWQGELAGGDGVKRLLDLERLMEDAFEEPQPVPLRASLPEGGRQEHRPSSRPQSLPARGPAATIAS